MAVLAAAQLLDELMGRNRNVAPNEKVKELRWDDPEYCKYYLVKFCPHDLFVNTRADLGVCPLVHDEEAKKMFQQAKPLKKLNYQEEFIRFCSSMINEVERKIQKGQLRLALSGKNNDLHSISPAQTQKNQEQIDILNERINGLEAEAEKAGTDGNVEQAQGLMKLCDQLKDERDNLKKQLENGHLTATAEIAAAQEKQMEVCQVCGAFLIVGDAQQRIDDHLMGKQHMGYARLKQALDEVVAVVHKVKEERRLGGMGSSGRDRDRDRKEGGREGRGASMSSMSGGGEGLGEGAAGLNNSAAGGRGQSADAADEHGSSRKERSSERSLSRDTSKDRRRSSRESRERRHRDRDRELSSSRKDGRRREHGESNSRDVVERERSRSEHRSTKDKDKDRDRERRDKDKERERQERKEKERRERDTARERDRDRDGGSASFRYKDKDREYREREERERERKHRSDRDYGRSRHHPYRR